MSSREQQIFACTNLLTPHNFDIGRSHNRATQMADRAFIGIPAEDVEYSRTSLSHVGFPVRARSVPSASQESDQFDEVYSYDGSHSGIANTACPVFTPQSGSDAPTNSQPQIMLNDSWTSPTGGPGSRHTPSISDSASLGMGSGMESPTLLSMQAQVSASRFCTPEALSPSEAMDSEQFDLLGGMSDTQETLRLGQEDIDFLQELQRIENQSPLQSSPNLLAWSHLSEDDPHVFVLGSSSPVPADTWTLETPVTERTEMTPARRSKVPSGPRVNKKERAALTSTARARAQKLREIGVCLRCLVNHESVRAEPPQRSFSSPYLG